MYYNVKIIYTSTLIILCILSLLLSTNYPINFKGFIRYSPVFMLIDISSFKINPYSIIFSSTIIIIITTIIGILKFNKLELR